MSGVELVGIRSLLSNHWYDALAAVLHDHPSADQADQADQAGTAEAAALAAAGRRILDLDAEDFAQLASGFASPWARRLERAAFPREPDSQERGALGSLVELYALMLEVMQVRSVRQEPLQIVVTAHLIGEYLLHLAWESTLGHAGDPAKLDDFVGGSRWGTDDPDCPHSSPLRSTARRALNACDGDVVGYTGYLDRFHSRLGEALAICAVNHHTTSPNQRPDIGGSCPNPCGFVRDLPWEQRRDLDARVRLARIYIDSPLVALRHHAPVGHFFGVPSVREISDAWLATWERVSEPWPDGSNPLLVEIARLTDRSVAAVQVVSEEALPGMGALVSAVAGRPVVAGTILAELGEDLERLLDLPPSTPAGTVRR